MAETKKTTRKPRTSSTSKKGTGTRKTGTRKTSTTRKSTSTRKTVKQPVVVEVKETETFIEPEVVEEEIKEIIETPEVEVAPDVVTEEETIEDEIDEELEDFEEETKEVEKMVVEGLDEPVKIDFNEKEEDEIVNLNYKKPTETSPVKDEVIPLGRDLREREAKLKKKDKMVDFGILVVICGLFILILTTYLSFSIDLSYKVTNTGVVIALVVELVGIALVIANSFSKK